MSMYVFINVACIFIVVNTYLIALKLVRLFSTFRSTFFLILHSHRCRGELSLLPVLNAVSYYIYYFVLVTETLNCESEIWIRSTTRICFTWYTTIIKKIPIHIFVPVQTCVDHTSRNKSYEVILSCCFCALSWFTPSFLQSHGSLIPYYWKTAPPTDSYCTYWKWHCPTYWHFSQLAV